MALYTGSSAIDVVLSRLENNDRFYTREHIRKVLNLCIQNSNLWVGWYQGGVTILTVKDRVCYDVPQSVIFPMSLTMQGRVINKSAFGALVADNQKLWKQNTANTGIQMSDWSLLGLKKFVVYPADSRGGRTMVLTGVMEPPLFDGESTTLNIPVNVMNAILDYASHLIQVKISGQPFMQSMSFYKIYSQAMRQLMMWRSQNQPYFTDETRAGE